MIKQYYYIDDSGNYCNVGTGNNEHQAEIEATIEKHAERHMIDPDKGKKIKVHAKKHVLQGGKKVEVSQDFVILLKPIYLGDI